MVKSVECRYGWETTIFRNREGVLHNARGPAIKTDYGGGQWDRTWYVSGLRHRAGGPAEENSDGRQWWYKHGKLHRTDGPAVMFPKGYAVGPQYWIDGVCYTKSAFDLHTSLMNLQIA